MARDQARNPGGDALPRLLSPREVAGVLGCSQWWVKEQARRRRIPFVMAGGAYRFTRDHLTEIITTFEQRPDQAQVPATPRRRAEPPPPPVPVVPLRARRPRRWRDAS